MHWLKSSDFLVLYDIQYNRDSFVGAAFRKRKKKRCEHDPNQACLENNFSPSPTHHSTNLTLPVTLPSHHLTYREQVAGHSYLKITTVPASYITYSHCTLACTQSQLMISATDSKDMR